jgi:SAM-dependent methyltransferase
VAQRLLSRSTLGRARELSRRLRAPWDRLRLPEAGASSEHWQRIVLNRAVDEHLARLGIERLSGAEISGDAHRGRPWRSYASLDYPAFDLCAPPEEHERFDVVICEQVLEHVLDPWRAASTLSRLCVPGGHVVVSTPFLIRVHELPAYGMPDFWRFTPSGLRLVLEQAGLEVDSVHSWGNRDCVAGNFDRWSAYRPWHSLRDERNLPVQVWAFARRPA